MSFSIIAYIVICVIAIILFLLHESEKGGMGIIGGYSNTLLGTSRVSFIGKVATIFAVLFFISALFLAILSSGDKSILKNLEPTSVPTETSTAVEEESAINPTTEQIKEEMTSDPSNADSE